MPERLSERGLQGRETERLLTFRAAGQLYALPAETVREVVKPLRLAKVPLGPRALLGLGNLRGAVLPVVGLAELLQRSAGGPAEARVIVLEGRTPLGLMVDTVETLTPAEAAEIKPAEAGLMAGEGELLLGVFQDGAGCAVRILDLQPLLARAFGSPAPSAGGRPAPALRQAPREAALPRAQATLIAFDVGGQEFALPIASVIEVMPTPEVTTALPHSEAAAVGMVGLRGSLLPMMSLQTLLGLTGVKAVGRPMTVIAAIGGAVVGLMVDGVREIIRIEADALEAVPAAIASRTKGESRVEAVIKVDGGRRLLAVISPEQLFREDIMKQIRRESAAPAIRPAASANAAERIFLVFSLGGQEYGLSVSAVEEVARLPDQIARLPRSPAFLKGVTNLRGAVLPIIDQRQRFELPVSGEGEALRLVVVRIGANIAGFIVDAVSEVLRAPESSIEAPPPVAEGARVLEGVLNLEHSGRMILLLDPNGLLSRAEQGALDALSTIEEAQAAIDQSPRR